MSKRYGGVYCGDSNAEAAIRFDRAADAAEKRGDRLITSVWRRLADRERSAMNRMARDGR